MLRDIYLRDQSDPKYKSNLLETSSVIESVLNKIRMILYTNRGEVLGEPLLGMDLESYLFQFNLNDAQIQNEFNAQIAKYVSESKDLKINLDVKMETDGVQNLIYLYIYIDSTLYMGLELI